MQMTRPMFETVATHHDTTFCSARPDIYIKKNAKQCGSKAWYATIKMTYPDGTVCHEPISGPYPTQTQAMTIGRHMSEEWLNTHAVCYERIM